MKYTAHIFHNAFGSDGSKVAVVELGEVEGPQEALSKSYRLTNTIEHPWWQNDGVTLVGRAERSFGVRSTSVGDIVVISDENNNQEAFLCEMVGWSQLYGDEALAVFNKM